MQVGTNNELSVVYTVLPGSTSSNRIIHVRERDAAEFKLEYPDFVRMPWRSVRHQVRDAEPGGALVVKPPRLAIGHHAAGKIKTERRVNDQKFLTVEGRAALSRAGSAPWRRGGKSAGRDSVVWELVFRCSGTACCTKPCGLRRIMFSATIAQVDAGSVTVTICGRHHPTQPYEPPTPSISQRRTREERDAIRGLTAAGAKPDRVRAALQWNAQRQLQDQAMHAALDPRGIAPPMPRLPKGTVPSAAYVSQVPTTTRPPL